MGAVSALPCIILQEVLLCINPDLCLWLARAGF